MEVCERLMGWMERTLELSSNKKLKSTHSLCVCRGDALCRYEGRWG